MSEKTTPRPTTDAPFGSAPDRSNAPLYVLGTVYVLWLLVLLWMAVYYA